PGTASAQDYTAGKTPAQLFASDCSACHKTPQGLAKGRDVRSLTGFLREHYTTKVESASALASYLAGMGGGGGERQKPGTAAQKPAEGERPKPRTVAAPPAATPTNPEEKAGEGEAKPHSRNAARTNEPRSRRTAAPDAARRGGAEGEPAPDAPGGRAKGGEDPAKPLSPRERARANRAAEQKLKSYAGAGGSAREIERSAAPVNKIESYATSGSPSVPTTNPEPAKDAAAPAPAAAP